MSAQRRRDALLSGTLFHGKYRLGKVLGVGGSAVVYEAADQFLQEPVALKLIPRSRDAGGDHVERVRREVKLLRRLHHPNLVQVHEAGIDEDHVFIVMEKLEGITLREILLSLRSLSVPETLSIGIQVAEAMAVAHARGVVHRDLKPENVMVTPGNVAKVFDFGVAKYFGYGFATTEDYGLRGTLLYMSPEQILRLTPDARMDVYALGVFLHEALAGQHYIVRRNPTMDREVGDDQIHYTPPLLSEELDHVPEPVAANIARMMHKSPERRHRDMTEVARSLRDALLEFERWAKRKRLAVEERDLLAAAGWSPGSARAASACGAHRSEAAPRDDVRSGSHPPTDIPMSATIPRGEGAGEARPGPRTLRLDEYRPPPPGAGLPAPSPVARRSTALPVRSVKFAAESSPPLTARSSSHRPAPDEHCPGSASASRHARRRGRLAVALTFAAGLVVAVPVGVVVASIRKSARQEAAASVSSPDAAEPHAASSVPAVARPNEPSANGLVAIADLDPLLAVRASANSPSTSSTSGAPGTPGSPGASGTSCTPIVRAHGRATSERRARGPASGLDRPGPLFTSPFVDPKERSEPRRTRTAGKATTGKVSTITAASATGGDR